MALNPLQQECTGPESTLVPGRVRGYRWFNPDPSAVLGITSVRGIKWQPVMQARCYPNRSSSGWYPSRDCQAPNPHLDHECGIYGWYAPHLIGTVYGLDTLRPVLGMIEAWGRVLLGGIGFRAEFARVVALSYVPNAALSRCHRHGITTYKDHEVMMDDWPPHDVSALVEIGEQTKVASICSQMLLQEARIMGADAGDPDGRAMIEDADKKSRAVISELVAAVEERWGITSG